MEKRDFNLKRRLSLNVRKTWQDELNLGKPWENLITAQKSEKRFFTWIFRVQR